MSGRGASGAARSAVPDVCESEDETTSTDELTAIAPARLLAGRYRLGPRLGAGGVATVFAAYDEALDRDVAVKVLHEHLAPDPVLRERFTREALHVSGLSHPGLVPVLDAGEDEGTAYLVLELVRGRTLRHVLDADGPLPVSRAVDIAAELCATLSATHGEGIVHRDIKPGNVMLADDGRIRLLDFGIAHTPGSERLTATATMVGTAAYLSPEQALGSSAGPRSDLYAVGCVLVEMLTGLPPFSADNPVSLLYRHAHDTPGPPSNLRPDVPADLDAAVLRLLAKLPEDRPDDADLARSELLAVRAGLDDAERPTTLPPLVAPLSATVVDGDGLAAASAASGPSGVGTFVASTARLGLAVAHVGAVRDRVVGATRPVTESRDRAGSAARRRPEPALVLLAALVVVAAALLAWRGPITHVAGGATPAATPSRPPASTPNASATPGPTRPASASPRVAQVSIRVPRASSATAAISVVAQVLAAGERARLVSPYAAALVSADLGGVSGMLGRGHGHPARARLGALETTVASLESGGQIAGGAVTALDAAMTQLASALGPGRRP